MVPRGSDATYGLPAAQRMAAPEAWQKSAISWMRPHEAEGAEAAESLAAVSMGGQGRQRGYGTRGLGGGGGGTFRHK